KSLNNMDNNQSEENPTSEVGSVPPPTFSEEQWRVVLEMQSRSLMEFAKTMHTVGRDQQKRGVNLPKYNPETAGADASKWCATANIILSERPLEGSELIMALSNSMDGTASQWLTQISYPGMQWKEFQELFLQRFASDETPAAMLLNFLNSRPTDGECHAVYASR
ncbi:hypothetical protein KR200_007312, partial [Drosophila serrata]